jgi:hypothetical protein
MKLKEALLLLADAPRGDTPSRINPYLTQAQAVKIVENAVATLGRPKNNPCQPEDDIDPLMEKRVYQVTRNQRRPKY